MRSIRLAVASAVVAVLVPVSVSPVGASNDFYTPPSPLGSGSPGQLIRSEPFTALALPLIPIQARAWRIMYRSTTATGGPVAVTGSVLVPRSAWRGPGARPLLGIAPGTQGLADYCAVSRQLANGTEYESAVIVQALMRGWAVAITDYQGIGTPGEHPYVVGRANGRAVLDSMRAARNLTAAGLDRHGPLAIYGFSEGGGAAGCAIQLQPTYAPDLPLEGAAVGAAPTDFNALARFLDGGPLAFLLAYSAIGFDAAYPELDLARYLTPVGVAAVKQLKRSCIVDAILGGLVMPKQIELYAHPNPLPTEAWQARLTQNDLGTIAPHVPVIVGGGRQDEVIPFSQDVTLYHRWCARGVNARFADIPISEHVTGGVLFAAPGLQFIAKRFAGEPLTRASDCHA